ncbi:MAG: methyl-accepting chemotaxis protein [Bacillota bacterium]
MKFKVGTKIILGYVVVLVILAVVAIVGNSGMQDLEEKYNYVLDRRIPVTVGIMQMDSHIRKQIINVRGFMLYRKEDAVKTLTDVCRPEIEKVKGELFKVLTTEQGKRLYARIDNADKTYWENGQRIIELYRADRDAEAEPYIAEAGKAIKDFEAAQAELVALNDELIKKNVGEAKDEAVKNKRILFVVSIVAVMIGLAAGIYMGRKISRPVIALTDVAGYVAEGDLTREVPEVKTGDEVETLGKAFKTMVHNLRDLLGKVNDSSQLVASTSEQLSANANQASMATQQVAAAVGEVAKGNNEQTTNVNQTVEITNQLILAIEQIAKGAQEQSANVLQTADIVNQMASAIQDVAANSQAVSTGAAKTAEVAEKGGEAVKKTVEGMERIKQSVFDTANKIKELGEHSQQIGEIIQVIDDIAEQTNLLALNAAIEAARAGEHGKGFAVVADEVRKLAERSGKATKEIADLITNIQRGTDNAVKAMEVGTGEVETGAQLAHDAGLALEEIVQQVKQAVDQIEGISAASEEMAASSNEVIKAIDNVSAITEENTAATEQMTASSNQVMNAMQNIAAISEESGAAAEEVSASTEELNASTEEIAVAANNLEKMATDLQQLIKKFKV